MSNLVKILFVVAKLANQGVRFHLDPLRRFRTIETGPDRIEGASPIELFAYANNKNIKKARFHPFEFLVDDGFSTIEAAIVYSAQEGAVFDEETSAEEVKMAGPFLAALMRCGIGSFGSSKLPSAGDA